MAENYILAIVISFVFVVLLAVLGMPSGYQLATGWDFAWFGGGIVGTAAACVVLTGVPCAVFETAYGVATLATYFGTGFLLTSGTAGTIAIIKALIMTPISLIFIYILAKLARGGG